MRRRCSSRYARPVKRRRELSYIFTTWAIVNCEDVLKFPSLRLYQERREGRKKEKGEEREREETEKVREGDGKREEKESAREEEEPPPCMEKRV
ncbi:hypothetical protein TNCV_2072161 [Trichonephila clavipes]|nr:hypothetical protein TNCV_2072161 [Trichonephila clavipes]